MTSPPLSIARAEVPPSPADAELEGLLTADAVARILSVRPKRVYELGIPRVKVSERCYRWRRDDVLAWIAARRSAA